MGSLLHFKLCKFKNMKNKITLLSASKWVEAIILGALFLLNSFQLSAQEPMVAKNYINYDSSIGNYRLKFEVDGVNPNFDYPCFVVLAGNWVDYPAHFLQENEKLFVEMDMDADLWLWESWDYEFYGAYFGEDGREYQTTRQKVIAPEVITFLKWKIRNSYMQTEAEFSGAEEFILNKNGTYFSVIDINFDSIIKGTPEILETEFFSNSRVKAMKDIAKSAIPEQFLGISGRFDNQFGQPKLFSYDLSAFRIGGELYLNYLVFGPGGIQVFRSDNMPVIATSYNILGQQIQQNKLDADQDFLWLPEHLPPSMNFINLPGYGSAKVLKIPH